MRLRRSSPREKAEVRMLNTVSKYMNRDFNDPLPPYLRITHWAMESNGRICIELNPVDNRVYHSIIEGGSDVSAA